MKKLLLLLLLLASPASAEVIGTIAGGVTGGSGISAGTVTATGATTARTGASYFSDLITPYDFGAVCDGTADDTTAMTAFIASRGTYLPSALTSPSYTHACKTTIARTAFSQAMWSFGGGRVMDTSGNLLGPIYSRVSSAPAVLGSYNNGSVLTAFNGDFSHVPLAIEHNVTGAATLGQPTSGYTYTLNAFPEYKYVFNSSGWNNSTSGNGGRTGFGGSYTQVYNAGQGDMTAHICSGYVASTKAGATSFLASPEVACLAGGMAAGVDGAYMEGMGDINLSDNGFDDAGFGVVNNYTRNNSTGALNANWVGIRQQSTGTKPIDAMFSSSGPTSIGIDLTGNTYADSILQSITMSNGGTGYTVGDLLTPPDGTFDQPLKIKVLTVSAGVISTWGIERAGKYSVVPATPSTVTGGTGSGAIFALSYGNGASMVMRSDTKVYMNATPDSSVFGTSFPSTTKLGTSYFSWSSGLSAFNFVANNTSALQVYSNQVLSTQPIRANNTINSSAGGGVVTTRADATAAESNSSRLGLYSFGGAIDASHTINDSSAIEAFATEGWSGTAAGSNLVLSTTGNTTLTRNAVLTLGQDKSATFTGSISGTAVIATGAIYTNSWYRTGSGGRVVNTTAAASTLSLTAVASTYVATPAAAITVTMAAPNNDGDRRRVCFGSATTVTWAVTAPATATVLPKTVFAAGECQEMVYNQFVGVPTNSAATTWYEY